MKKFNTLEELREALMSEDGAVYFKIEGENRFRIKDRYLEKHCVGLKAWLNVSQEYNHGFIFDLENWTRYEKPKKIVKESFDIFVEDDFLNHSKINYPREFSFSFIPVFCKNKATITIEREVEE